MDGCMYDGESFCIQNKKKKIEPSTRDCHTESGIFFKNRGLCNLQQTYTSYVYLL